ncbi:transcription factor ces-2-like [Mercenaria mercenaria]|uniref:transcription factor ces-2-like n=1 Tax=Mercenaria mercenaria TaxID=6596 RepID=UPI001E1D9598|nr:transcription factor ces-2-like [Mercenaria mercenaria]
MSSRRNTVWSDIPAVTPCQCIKMSDAALDLSSKSTATKDDQISRRSFSDDTPPSPRTPVRTLSSSDGNESDSSSLPPSAIKPVPGPIPTSIRDSPCSNPDINHGNGDSLPSSPTTPSSAGTSRPFKSYPLESMTSVFTSPASAALLSSHATGLPTGLPVGLGLSSLYESSASFPSFPVTPLTSHLLQRKRRAESRSSSNTNQDSNSDSENKKLKHVPEEKKDNSYWERRRKNNEAAKRSRDNRRCKEEEIAMRAAFLEQENLKLRAQVAILKNETAKLHYMLYNRI